MEILARPGLDGPGFWQGGSMLLPELALMGQWAVGGHKVRVLAVTAAAEGQGKTPAQMIPCKRAQRVGDDAFCSTTAAQCLLVQILWILVTCISTWEQLFTACGPGRNQQDGCEINKLIQASPIDFPGLPPSSVLDNGSPGWHGSSTALPYNKLFKVIGW
ncbi:hypothetical protein BTVI_70632 [Pitangus sulphuratus]|nr:hypothetical protein BTVI_70632 [Pitangus sulphuratus]